MGIIKLINFYNSFVCFLTFHLKKTFEILESCPNFYIFTRCK